MRKKMVGTDIFRKVLAVVYKRGLTEGKRYFGFVIIALQQFIARVPFPCLITRCSFGPYSINFWSNFMSIQCVSREFSLMTM